MLNVFITNLWPCLKNLRLIHVLKDGMGYTGDRWEICICNTKVSGPFYNLKVKYSYRLRVLSNAIFYRIKDSLCYIVFLFEL